MTTSQSEQLALTNNINFNEPEEEDVFVMPVSFAQQRMWLIDQLQPDNPAYNISRAYRLTGSLNTTTLEQALNKLIQRHEALRTAFSVKDNQPVQVIASNLTLTLQVIDLRELPGAKQDAEVKRLVSEEVNYSFDLTQAPLLRVSALRLDKKDYLFLLTIHHIISDGWSMDILFRELSSLYKTFSTGQISPLPELPIQYADFAVWQREWLQGDVLETQLAYWKQQLAGAPPVLELPTDQPRPAVQSFQGAQQSVTLSKSLSTALKKLSQQEGATLFMTLLAAFKLLLYRYTGQDDIVVGTPIANRNRVEIEGVIGFFVNTLVLRTDHSEQPTFRELLGRVREVALAAYVHQDLPFEKLVQELVPERHLNRNPLFQVMFVFQDTPRQSLDLGVVGVDFLPLESKIAKFDLTLSITESAEGLKGYLSYNSHLFDATTIERMVGHFQTLLKGIVTNPEMPITHLPLLTPTEQHQLLVDWNDTQVDYPKDKYLHQLFEIQVEQTPDAVAVIYEDQQLTYRQLNNRANQLAYHLQSLGVEPETLVGLYVERSLEMIVGLLAILKAGGAYVPLSPFFPKERLGFILTDTKMSILLTKNQLTSSLPAHNIHTICLDNEKPNNNIAMENPIHDVTPTNLAYVIYTSGSTGQPKGVLIEHQQIHNYVMGICEHYQLLPGASYAMVQPLAVDSSQTVIFPPLITGGTLHIISEDRAIDANALSDYFTDHSIDLLKIAPSHLMALQSAASHPSQLLPKRWLIVGGEFSHPDWATELAETVPGVLYNHYGPTETTVGVLTYRLQPNQLDPHLSTIPIGQPLPNVNTYILNQNLQPVPVGIPGELYIGGAGVARGYLNRPNLTTEKFIPNPFSKNTTSRLYKTGDLARYLSNGNVEFLGRIDNQVKLHGFRIELGEIEAILGQHPLVQTCVVTLREDTPGQSYLAAYVVPKESTIPPIAALRAILSEQLPSYMIPSAFVFLDELARTPHGKIDRRALPTPLQTRPNLKTILAAPKGPIEEMLTDVWQEVLGIKQVGIYDNFFELGGHSLLAMRLVTQIEKVTGKKISLATLFQAPTIEQLANILHQEGWLPSTSSLVPLHSGGTKPPFFCIPGNLGNVFKDLGYLAQHIDPDQPFYSFQDGIQVPAKIEAMATHYLNELRSMRPKGPYLLGGICSGGVIAFEMAQQLQAQGEQVEFLALVEPSHPRRTYTQLAVYIFHRILRRFSHQSNQISELKVSEQRTYLRLKAKVLANTLARSRYTPKMYQGQIDLFLTGDTLKRKNISQLNWGNLATNGANLHEIPGTHDAIVGDNDTEIEENSMQVLAEKLNVLIEEILEKANFR